MCGIAGFVGTGSTVDLRAMTASLAHRGPDDEAFFEDPRHRVFLGHRRLVVLDADGGRQPMISRNGSVAVIFNGEIYNHRDLRTELEVKGHRFASDHSDTEVLVHGYEEWGERLPDHLDGMFAFAIYDKQRRRLFLARDRFGKKPLFYTSQPGLFAFASELTALERHSGLQPSLDAGALRKFFAYNFFPAPLTPFKGVYKLPGGHCATVGVQEEFQPTTRRYWRFRIEPFSRVPARAAEEWGEQVRHLLEAAVRRRLESDVPLGFLLSGGMDSSAVLALAARHLPRHRLKTFCVGFSEPSYDESNYASSMANFVGAEHQQHICSIQTVRDLMPEVLEGLDEPLGDSSILPTSQLCEFARRSVTVALCGDGGDELFAGYDPFKALKLAKVYRRVVPRPLHQAVSVLAARLPQSDRYMSIDFKIRRGLRGAAHRPALWNPIWVGALGPEEIGELTRAPVDLDELYAEAIELWEDSESTDPVDRTLEFFTNLYLQDDILVKSDRASMRVSLELRSPFLDTELVDFVRRIPHNFKFRDGKGKFILRHALAGVLPKRVLNRRKKGFGIPLAGWLRELHPPKRLAEGALPGLDERWLEERWHLHRRKKADYRHCLWDWLVLQRRFAGRPI